MVEDSILFNELIVNKDIVAVVRSYDVDAASSGELVLTLDMIDNSGKEPLYIRHVLVEENRANSIAGEA